MICFAFRLLFFNLRNLLLSDMEVEEMAVGRKRKILCKGVENIERRDGRDLQASGIILKSGLLHWLT